MATFADIHGTAVKRRKECVNQVYEEFTKWYCSLYNKDGTFNTEVVDSDDIEKGYVKFETEKNTEKRLELLMVQVVDYLKGKGWVSVHESPDKDKLLGQGYTGYYVNIERSDENGVTWLVVVLYF